MDMVMEMAMTTNVVLRFEMLTKAECCIADLERISVAASPTANCPQQSITNLSNQIVMMTMMMMFVMKIIHLLQILPIKLMMIMAF